MTSTHTSLSPRRPVFSVGWLAKSQAESQKPSDSRNHRLLLDIRKYRLVLSRTRLGIAKNSRSWETVVQKQLLKSRTKGHWMALELVQETMSYLTRNSKTYPEIPRNIQKPMVFYPSKMVSDVVFPIIQFRDKVIS